MSGNLIAKCFVYRVFAKYYLAIAAIFEETTKFDRKTGESRNIQLRWMFMYFVWYFVSLRMLCSAVASSTVFRALFDVSTFTVSDE
jgi:hypothetical protein